MLVLAVDIDCVVVVAAVAVGGCAADASAWSCFWLLASNLTSHLKENFVKKYQYNRNSACLPTNLMSKR